MTDIQSYFDHHAFSAFVVTLAVLLLALAWLLRVHSRARALESRLDAILGDVAVGNTPQMLAEYLQTVRSTAAATRAMKAEHDQVARLMPTVVRHIGLVRFSPFHDTGGDQSFTLALLDGRADGVVITALHSRSDSRLYAKPVERGKSSYSLTPEEIDAIDRALHGQSAPASS